MKVSPQLIHPFYSHSISPTSGRLSQITQCVPANASLPYPSNYFQPTKPIPNVTSNSSNIGLHQTYAKRVVCLPRFFE